MVTEIVDTLSVEASDSAILSVIYEGAGDHWKLRHGSLIFGPAELADESWASWHERNAGHLHGAAGTLGATFAHSSGGFVMARLALSPDAVTLLLESLGSGQIPAFESLPPALADLVAPPSPIRVFPHLGGEAGRLAFLAARPIRAFLLELSQDEAGSPFPENWTIDGQHVHAPDRWDVGVVASPSTGPVAPRGLLIGRLERRAWIREMRGLDDELHYYGVSIGVDPALITPYELVVEMREWVGEELAFARRLPLEWLDLSAWTSQDHVELTLPMLGSGAKRAISLYDLGGELLDVSDAQFLVESVHVQMNVLAPNGAVTATEELVVGDKLERTLEDRLERLASIEHEYRQLIADGMANRVVLKGDTALPYLRKRLEAVPGAEILVMDRYFGADASDWQLVDGLSVPVRVLVSKPGSMPPEGANLKVRRWQRPASGGAPPFHDRVYLWEGGGLSVGTSPGGLGVSDSRIDSLDPAEVGLLRTRFEQLWASPDFVLM